MTTPQAPKRRGRPPGNASRLTVVSTAPQPEPPAPVELVALEGIGPIRVILMARRAFSSPAEVREVSWPAGWRLPSAGELIHVSKDWGGRVENVDFNLGDGAIVVHLR